MENRQVIYIELCLQWVLMAALKGNNFQGKMCKNVYFQTQVRNAEMVNYEQGR